MNNSPDALKNEILQLRQELAEERARNEFLLSAIESLPNPIFIKDAYANFVFFNKTYEEFFGMKRQDFIGKSVMELPYLSMADRKHYHTEDLHLIRNSCISHYDVDFTSIEGRKRPSFYWSCGFTTPHTGQKGLVGEIVNISKERDLEAQLQYNIEQLEIANATIAAVSKMDGLTGLYNRRFLEEIATVLTGGNSGADTPVCFLMADLDHFKMVNDTFGHLTGDDILVHFADILKTSCRENEFPIRYGGEEFLLLLPDINLSTAKKIAERIRTRAAHELFLPDESTLTVSIGVTQYRHGENLNDCIQRADAALYQAKNTGRNKVIIE